MRLIIVTFDCRDQLLKATVSRRGNRAANTLCALWLGSSRSSASVPSAGPAAPAVSQAHASLGAHMLSILFFLAYDGIVVSRPFSTEGQSIATELLKRRHPGSRPRSVPTCNWY
jgi:hypothetical protein